MVNVIGYLDKLQASLTNHQKDVLTAFESVVSEIHEELRAEERAGFNSGFISSAQGLAETIKKKMDYISCNQGDEQKRDQVKTAFGDLTRFIALFDAYKGKNISFDDFIRDAQSYNIDHNTALIILSALCLDIESVRQFSHQRMFLIP